MKILFHAGVGNLDRPNRWVFVNQLYVRLARTLEKLGHESMVWSHEKARTSDHYKNHIQSVSVTSTQLDKAIEFKPDWVFTWNGSCEGDKIIKEIFGEDKMIYGELAFFNHYKTLYFDFSGVNGNSENLTEELLPFDEGIYNEIKKRYIKSNITDGRFIFVPLQDEKDTNITMYSPFKKMDEVLDHIEKNYKLDDGVKVLYKTHPNAPAPKIAIRNNFYKVTGDVHHYLPYAEMVIGINSNTLLEGLIYHNNVVTLGKGITSREFIGDEHKQYISHLYQKQMPWDDLKDVEKIKNSIFYNRMLEKLK